MAETPFGVLVGQLARAAPSFPAITCAEVTISRAELEARTNRLARAYRDLGVTPGLARHHRAAERDRVLRGRDRRVEARRDAAADLVPAARRRSAARSSTSPTPRSWSAWTPPRRPAARRSPPASSRTRRCRPIRFRPRPPASFKAPTSGGSTGRPKLIVATQPAIVGSRSPTTARCCGCHRTACTSSPARSITTARSRARPSRCSRATTSW